jgi:2,3-diphosphopglycerate-independent phosphoglycerate mutase
MSCSQTVRLFVSDGLLRGESDHVHWLARPDVISHGACTGTLVGDPPNGFVTAPVAFLSAEVGPVLLLTEAAGEPSSVEALPLVGELVDCPRTVVDALLDSTRQWCVNFGVSIRLVAVKVATTALTIVDAWTVAAFGASEGSPPGYPLTVMERDRYSAGNVLARYPQLRPSRRPQGTGDHARCAPFVFVMLDGGSDTGAPELGGLTPLQVVSRAYSGLNTIAAHGASGLLDPVAPGLACGSDTAHLSMLGFDPRTYFKGRGAFEAIGGGMDMAPGDLGFKCNFATWDAATGIVTRRKYDEGAAAERDASVLCDALDARRVTVGEDEYVMRVKHAAHHRCGVVLRGPHLTACVTGTDPIVDGKPLLRCEPTPNQGSGEAGKDAFNQQRTCNVVNAFVDVIAEVLRTHAVTARRLHEGQPVATTVLFRGAAELSAQASFEERFGLRACAVAPTCIIAGLCATLGIHVLPSPPGATGDEHTDVTSKAQLCISVLTAEPREFDFFFLHVKGTDEAAHAQNPIAKVDMLRRVSDAIDALWSALPNGTTFALTSDHTTPCTVGDHTADPVAVAVGVKGSLPSSSGSAVYFDEVSCARGALGRMLGGDVITEMLRRSSDYARL